MALLRKASNGTDRSAPIIPADTAPAAMASTIASG
jgi:hypothetical protein